MTFKLTAKMTNDYLLPKGIAQTCAGSEVCWLPPRARSEC